MTSPDYTGVNKEDAVRDFKIRIQHYAEFYEPLDEEHDKDYSFIRIYNQGEKFLVNRVQGDYLISHNLFSTQS